MTARLIWVTPEAEKVVAYCARVSNPANQDNENIEGLLNYCLRMNHWSPFEMASMCVEIKTSRDISAQILRHRSFNFQEFSTRYAEISGVCQTHPRRQDLKNRQNSTDDLSEEVKNWWYQESKLLEQKSIKLYGKALKFGIAKECARRLLPLSTETTLYMSGTVRSWIHYIELRTTNGTQLEHMDVAKDVGCIFKENFPILGKRLLF